MGILQWLGLSSPVINAAVTALPNARTGILSPWSEGELGKFVYSDIFGTDVMPVTRKEAMSVPAYAKGRNLIVGMLSDKPLRALDANGLLKDQPTWLSRTDTDVSPWQRMASTIDDLIFYGHSLWIVQRGAGESPKGGPILDAARCPQDQWRVNGTTIELRVADDTWAPANESSVIYIPGPMEGLLNVATESIRGAKSLEATWIDRAQNPVPMLEVRVTDDSVDQETLDTWLTEWRRLRRQKGGSVGATPAGIELVEHGAGADSQLFIEGRNASRLDAAAFLNLNGMSLDASLSTASLTYTTTEGKSIELHERLPFWTMPIEARLSMDDVCPRGQRIRFDFSSDPTVANPSGTGPFQED